MIPYIITFFASVLLLFISGKIKSGSFKKLLIIIALLLPCVLAGMRALDVGTDTRSYSEMFNKASESTSINEYLDSNLQGNRAVGDFEPGFTFLLFFVSQFGDYHLAMFVIELLIILPIYFGCKKNKYLKNKIWLCMLVYYLLFFNVGLNAMREYVALSFAFYAICTYLSEDRRRILKYLVATIIAILFHKVALLSIPIILIHYLVCHKHTSKIVFGKIVIPMNIIRMFLVLVLALVLTLNMNVLDSFLYSADGFQRYTSYYDGEVSLTINYMIKVVPILIISIVLLKKFIKKYDSALLYVILFCFSTVIFGLLANTSLYGDRISDIFKIFNVVYFPMLAITPDSKRGRIITTSAIIIYCIVYFNCRGCSTVDCGRRQRKRI